MTRKIKPKNNKGVIGIIYFFAIILIILIIGFMAAILVGVIDYASDTITPELTSIGVVGSANLSQIGQNTFGTLDIFIQQLPWLLGFGYVVALIGSIIFAIGYTYNPNPIYIGVYVFMILALIFGAIVISNMYQDLYSGTDDIATRLQEQTIMSFMILQAPAILTLIAFITGIYIFSAEKMGATI